MSTGLIIAIIVVVLILIALLVMLPRMKRKAELQKRERELGHRREAVATEHRETADVRQREAEQAERQRAEAELHQERATMHERGDADHELIDESERDKFAGTSADPDGTLADQSRNEPRGEFEEGREVGHEEAADRDGRFTRDEQATDTTDTPGSRRA